MTYDDVSLRPVVTYNLSYDAENRLSGVSGAATATFVYDGDGRRVKATAGGVTTTYIGDYLEWTGSTTTMVKYYYAGATRVAMRVGSNNPKWLLSDHLGSQSIVASYNGLTEEGELRYKAWGETRYTSGTTPTKRQYTGQLSDSYINLYWYNSRWFDPELGRFLSPDTIIPSDGGSHPTLTVDYHETQFLEQLNQENRKRLDDPQTKLSPAPTNPPAYDRYSYVFNNPLKYSDPTGHCLWDLCIMEIAGVSFGLAELAVIFGGGAAALALSTPQGREAATQAMAEGLDWASEQVLNGINVAFHKNDWIPDNLLPEKRSLWGRAAEKYKAAYPGLPRGFQLPKELARELADLLNEGKSIDEAVDDMPELDDFVEGDDSE